jgi:Ser/Thr protein kinase RdoA (MazF antagonist)
VSDTYDEDFDTSSDDHTAEHPFAALTPNVVLDAIERFGFECTGGLYPLNSYENRVYLAQTEDGDSAVAKFYRPERWPDASILEEHRFAAELADREIPVVAPLATPDGTTLIEHEGFRVAVYPRIRGHAPELDNASTLGWVGRFLGRIHAVAATATFEYRPTLNVETFGYQSLNDLLDTDLLPMEARTRYEGLARELLSAVEERIQALGPTPAIRLHGDCHAGNILWAPTGPHFVDLDDCRVGPAIQDFWMLLSGNADEMSFQLSLLVEGYQQFHDFDFSQLGLIEPLRGLRAIYYASWLAKRWHDPAFPQAFPWFGTNRYWEDQVQQLQDQLEHLDDTLVLSL